MPTFSSASVIVPSSSSSATALSKSIKDYINSDKYSSKRYVAVSLGSLVAVWTLFFVWPISCVVDVGQIGIANTLGSIERYDPGLHYRNPIMKIEYLNTKTELLEQSNYVPTKEGLTVELDTAVLLRVNPKDVISLYGSVGPKFISKLVEPELSSAVRGLTSEVDAKALYTSGRSELQNRLKEELIEKLSPRGIIVEDVLLKDIVLPADLTSSIEEKALA
jgi:prohibitin 1